MALSFLESLLLLVLILLEPVSFVRCQTHTSNHAVILSASKYWFNYRHNANALSIYKILKENGFDDDNIVLMLADDFITNPRNPIKNQIFTKPGAHSKAGDSSVFNPHETKIDYRGEDVTVENFVNVLTGRQHVNLPVLQSDENSQVLIYLTGHGGDQFFKFQDIEEILASQLADALDQMHSAGRYREILLVADTCQAFTLGDKIRSPNVTVIGSSLRDESSYAHHADPYLGLSIIEKYTYFFTEEIQKAGSLERTLQQVMVDPYSFKQQRAHIGATDENAVRKLNQVAVKDFFTNIKRQNVKSRKLETSDILLLSAEKLPSISFQPKIEDTNSKTEIEMDIDEAEVCDDERHHETKARSRYNSNAVVLAGAILASVFILGSRF